MNIAKLITLLTLIYIVFISCPGRQLSLLLGLCAVYDFC